MLEAIKEVSQHGTYYHFQFEGKDIKAKIREESLEDLPARDHTDLIIELADLLSESAGVKISGNDVLEAIRKVNCQ